MKKRILALLFLLAPSASHALEMHIQDLSAGMYSYPTADKIPDNGAAFIQNFFTDIQGMAVERTGFTVQDSNLGSTAKSVPGLWRFVDNTGSEWIIEYSSRTFYKHTVGASPVAFGLVSTTNNQPRAATNLGKIMFVNGVDAAWTFDGTSTATVAGAPIGTLIVAWRTRFVIANITGSLSTVRFSADGDATSWTLGGNPTDPFSIQIGGANDGYNVKCMGNYLDYLILQRKYDSWAVAGFDQSDVTNRNISSEIGCIDPGTNREFDGTYLFLSWRGMEEMTGFSIKPISDPIRNFTDLIVRNTNNQRSNIQTSQSDFAAGTTPSALSTSISPGSVVLSTLAASSAVDSGQSDFAAGTLTSVSATDQSASVVLSKNSNPLIQQYGADDNSQGTNSNGCNYSVSQSFTTGAGKFVLWAIIVRWRNTTSGADARCYLYNDSGNAPNAQVAVGTPDIPTTIGTSFSDQTINFSSVTLSANTRYWIRMTGASVPFGSNISIVWATTNGSFSESARYWNGSACANNTSQSAKFKLYGTQYVASGNIVSRVFDIGFTTNTWLWPWGTFTANSVLPSGGAITYETQSSADGTNFDSLLSVTSGNAPTSTVRRYIRYKASLTTSDQSITPQLDDVTINYGPFVSTGGVYTSQLITIGSLASSWGPVTISNSVSNGTITYQFGSTNTASVGAISNWASITSGAVPSVSTATYAAFRATFAATNNSASLFLQDFQTTWNEGLPLNLASAVYDRRYWLSLTTNTASGSVLDSVFVYQRNRTWTLLKGITAASFALWRDNLLFGDSNTTGNVYQFDVGNNDNGSAITSQIVSKSYDMQSHFKNKDYRRAYLTFYGGSSGSFTFGFYNDQQSTLYNLGTANMNDNTGQVWEKYNFSLDGSVPLQGREIQYVLTKSGTGDRLKLFDITLDYLMKEAQ